MGNPRVLPSFSIQMQAAWGDFNLSPDSICWDHHSRIFQVSLIYNHSTIWTRKQQVVFSIVFAWNILRCKSGILWTAPSFPKLPLGFEFHLGHQVNCLLSSAFNENQQRVFKKVSSKSEVGSCYANLAGWKIQLDFPMLSHKQMQTFLPFDETGR
jgi:hypothetical protein